MSRPLGLLECRGREEEESRVCLRLRVDRISPGEIEALPRKLFPSTFLIFLLSLELGMTRSQRQTEAGARLQTPLLTRCVPLDKSLDLPTP